MLYPASACSRFKSLVLGRLVQVALRFKLRKVCTTRCEVQLEVS